MDAPRYTQTSEDGHYSAEFGYDNPLSTYYLQIFDVRQKQLADEAAARIDAAYDGGGEPTEDDCRLADKTGMVVWVGTRTAELPTVESLAAKAAPYVTIPAETIEALRADQAAAPGPTSFQRGMRELVESMTS
jgi:hypothetical protein